MIRMAICDDDQRFCRQIIMKTAEIMKEEFTEIPYQMESCHNQEELLSAYEPRVIDVLFLDIEVGEENGFEIANEIGRRYAQTKIVFITTHDNLVYDSFEYRPFGFVRKRLFEEEFTEVMRRMIRIMVDENSIITFGELKTKKMFMVSEICVVESVKHNIRILFLDRQIEIRDKISSHVDELKKDGFVQINKGVFIHLKYVTAIENKEVSMENGMCYAVSRNYQHELMEKYELYQMKVQRKKLFATGGRDR